MKHIFKILFFASVLVMAAAPIIRADDSQPLPDNSSAELNRIKGLAGRWTSKTSMFGKPDERVYTEYRVTSGGSGPDTLTMDVKKIDGLKSKTDHDGMDTRAISGI